jgi:photosystem II PsbZ protein
VPRRIEGPFKVIENHMLFIFQLSLFAFVALSLALLVGVPVAFASPEGWASTKNIVFSGATLWIFLIFLVGILNSFVV